MLAPESKSVWCYVSIIIKIRENELTTSMHYISKEDSVTIDKLPHTQWPVPTPTRKLQK
jgi:hypothetical protein